MIERSGKYSHFEKNFEDEYCLVLRRGQIRYPWRFVDYLEQQNQLELSSGMMGGYRHINLYVPMMDKEVHFEIDKQGDTIRFILLDVRHYEEEECVAALKELQDRVYTALAKTETISRTVHALIGEK